MNTRAHSQVIEVITYRVHDWGPSGGGGGWTATSCNRCGRTAFGSTRKWDLLSLMWPSRFGCQKARLRVPPTTGETE